MNSEVVMNHEPNKVLDLLNDWLDQHQSLLNERGLKVVIVYGQPTDKTGRYIDLDSKTHAARAIIWESGELDLEALEVDSDRHVIVEHHIATDSETLFPILNRFVERIS